VQPEAATNRAAMTPMRMSSIIRRMLSRAPPKFFNFTTLSLCSSRTITHLNRPFRLVKNDCVEVDELILQIADYKNDFSDMAAEKLMRKCSTSWESYQYLRDRVHESWLPDRARQQLRQIIKRIRWQMLQRREFGYAYEQS